MRKSFAQVLRGGDVDIRQEYDKLYSILHQKAFDHKTKSLYEVFGESFPHFYFRGTCLSIEEFDYNLPEELIAQVPIKDRCKSRLLVMDKKETK